jgi:hypothetical protein
VNLPVGALAVLGIIPLPVPEEKIKPNPLSLLPRIHHYLDLVGFILLAPAILQLLLALQFGGQAHPWKSAVVIGLLCGSGKFYCLGILESIPRRRRNATSIAYQSERCPLFRALRGFPHVRSLRRHLLPSAIFPGCEWRERNQERSVSPPSDHITAHNGWLLGCCW